MKENQTHIFYLNGLPKCKMYFSLSMMFFLLYIGLEKAIQIFNLSGGIFGVLRWWFLGSGIILAFTSLTYFALHKKLTLATVNGEGIIYLWGMFWNRIKIEVAWVNVNSADISMVYKKSVVRPVRLLPMDMGWNERVLKIVLNGPLSEKLSRQVEDVNKQFWWDGFMEANKQSTEIYLREEPYGGYEPLLSRIRKYVE